MGGENGEAQTRPKSFSIPSTGTAVTPPALPARPPPPAVMAMGRKGREEPCRPQSGYLSPACRQ